jgi:plasmid stability protein
MAQLLVRKIENAVVEKLRLRAASDGISVEEEHRRILRNALLPKKGRPAMNFKEYLLSMPEVGNKELFKRDRSPMRKSPF